jgi:hypothetical protein
MRCDGGRNSIVEQREVIYIEELAQDRSWLFPLPYALLRLYYYYYYYYY